MGKQIAIFVSLSLLAVLSAACGSKPEDRVAARWSKARPAPPLIRSEGAFKLPAIEEVLDVERVGTSVAYRVGDQDIPGGNAWGLIGKGEEPWFMHGTSEGELWVFEAEVGVLRWSRNAEGLWKGETVANAASELIPEIPEVFYQALPAETRAAWSVQREVASQESGESAAESL